MTDRQRPPGWYTDPDGGQMNRWWDGEEWSGRYQPPPVAQAPVSAFSGCLWLVVGVVALVVIVGLWPGCGDDEDESGPDPASSETVTAAELGEDWPLTVESGTLACEISAVTFEADGVTYWVNGLAGGRADAEGWVDIDPIWAADPDGIGPKKDIGPLINRGRALC